MSTRDSSGTGEAKTYTSALDGPAQVQCSEHQPRAVLPTPPQDLLSSPSLSSPVPETLVISTLERASIQARFISVGIPEKQKCGGREPWL